MYKFESQPCTYNSQRELINSIVIVNSFSYLKLQWRQVFIIIIFNYFPSLTSNSQPAILLRVQSFSGFCSKVVFQVPLLLFNGLSLLSPKPCSSSQTTGLPPCRAFVSRLATASALVSLLTMHLGFQLVGLAFGVSLRLVYASSFLLFASLSQPLFSSCGWFTAGNM